MAISIERYRTALGQLPGMGNYLSEALRILEEGVNNLGKHIQVDPAGTMPAPSVPQSLTVKTNGTGLVHAVVSDSNAINKNIHYFLEYSTDPNAAQWHIKPLGPSRSMEPITLPAMDDNGNPQSFYFRAYSQYQGSNPSKPIYFGGSTPTAVNPGGSQQLTLIPSTGSGTGSNTGEQSNVGFGVQLVRPKGST